MQVTLVFRIGIFHQPTDRKKVLSPTRFIMAFKNAVLTKFGGGGGNIHSSAIAIAFFAAKWASHTYTLPLEGSHPHERDKTSQK